MKATSILVLGAAIAGGFAASKALLAREEPPQGFPTPLQDRVDSLHGRLHRMRARATEALAEGRAERHDAERELRADYLARTGRTEPITASMAMPPIPPLPPMAPLEPRTPPLG